MAVPETRYAKTDDGVHIAYQAFGSGPPVVIIPPLVSNVELVWEQELFRRVFEYCADHVTIVQFDKRGIGTSDRWEQEPTLEQRIDDISTVMDAEGLDRASLIGLSEGGLMSQLFAIRHPERVDRLELINSLRGFGHPSMTYEFATHVLGKWMEIYESWGQRPELLVDLVMPSHVDNPEFMRWVGRWQRMTASPQDFLRQLKSVAGLEVPPNLDTITAPTAVIHCSGDRVVLPPGSRDLAREIPNAVYVEIESDDHFVWVTPNWRDFIDVSLEHVTGSPVTSHYERRFAVVLFTDLVGSTSRSAAMGDERWHTTLESHNRICASIVERHRGRIVKSTGDGILATFDVPSAAVTAAAALRDELAGVGLTIRAGVHAGEIEVHSTGDISGVAVNVAQRVEASAENGTVWVSSTVRDLLLGSQFAFEDRGERSLKGMDGAWRLYALAR